ncbi:MAG: apolipoprotein N-acyltransferase [Rickettsiales bacterium]|nr:apolipoprotein N-acyltransferase [Rickettsiales bacterium]MCA0254222.1 apolipoprotein N-acyltransferase [Pseudomonadota bacterium]
MVLLRKRYSFFSGIICGMIFAPVYFLPGLFALSLFAAQVKNSVSYKQVVTLSYIFGFGFFLASLYWISFGPAVYFDEFWWVIPFAFVGLPAFIAIFTILVGLISYKFKESFFYHFVFALSWLFIEWLISWIFTGLPWAMLGYGFSISELFIQPASLFGILGLSFIAVFIGSSFYSREHGLFRATLALIILSSCIVYGYLRLQTYKTEYSDIKIRIVQPSIPQIDKWDGNIFWENMAKQIELSKKGETPPDIIVWSEAALTVPYYYKPVFDSIMSVFTKKNQVLLSGGVSDNNKKGDELEIYSSLIALGDDGKLLFDYHKAHLVPFGEYMPLKSYIPLKKLTHGVLDYTEGAREVLTLNRYHNLRIQPLICYESIFFDEVRISNQNADIIVNVTNDAWYGKSSGPYQHMQISRIRAVENGLPLIRSANNGISAVVDPLGRVLDKLELNEINIIDSYLPLKLNKPTIYAKYGYLSMMCVLVIVLMLHLLYHIIVVFKRNTI